MNRNILNVSILFACLGCLNANAQKTADITNGITILLDNEKIRITKYVALPGKNVCGEGMHTHSDHCNILLSDVKVNKPDGSSEIQTFDFTNKKIIIEKDGKILNIPSEGVVWANGETHTVVNIGEKLMKFYIVEVK